MECIFASSCLKAPSKQVFQFVGLMKIYSRFRSVGRIAIVADEGTTTGWFPRLMHQEISLILPSYRD